MNTLAMSQQATRTRHLLGLFRPGLLAVVIVSGCGLNEPQPPPFNADFKASQIDAGAKPNTAETTGPATKPFLDTVSEQNGFCGTTFAITGRAGAGQKVISSSPAGQNVARAGADGRFCIAVSVLSGQKNNVEVRAQNVSANDSTLSEPAFVTLTPAGSCPETSGQQLSTKQSVSGTDPTVGTSTARATITTVKVSTNAERVEGDDLGLIDGNLESFVEYAASDFTILPWNWKDWARSDEMWIWLKLDKPRLIDHIIVHWRDRLGNGNKYATKYYVGISTSSNPGTPTPPLTGSNPIVSDDASPPSAWDYLSRRLDKSGGRDTIDLSHKQPLVEHIALWLEDDADTFSFAEEFAISEIEVYSRVLSGNGSAIPSGVGRQSTCGL